MYSERLHHFSLAPANMSNSQREPTTVIGSMSGELSETESSDASCDGGTKPSMAVDDMFESSLVPLAVIPSKNSTNGNLFDRIEVSTTKGTPEGAQGSGTNKITIDLPSLPEFEHTTSHHSRADPWRKTLTSGGEIEKFDERTTLDTTFGITYRPITDSNPPQYRLPYRPAFVDEGEFEQQMNAEFRIGEEAGLPQTGDSSDVDAFKANGNDTTKDESDDFQDAALIKVLDKQPLNYNTQRNYDTTTCAVHASGDSSTQERSVNTSKPNIDSQVVFAKALKQLMGTYQEGKGCALSKEGLWAPSLLSNVTADSVGGAPHPGFGSTSVGNTFTIVGGDVRYSPIMEVEEEANKEKEDNQHGRARKGPQDADDRERQRRGDKEHCAGTEREEGKRGIVEGVEGGVETPHTRAVREWKAIEQLRTAENSVPMEKGVGDALHPISIDESSRMVSTTEVLRHFRSQDLGMYKAAIVPLQPQQGGLWLFRRKPILTIAGGDELRDEVFLLAQVHYTPDDVMHRRLIRTIYRRMTLEKRACPDFGSHWETIGFQGNDPGTDLNRSMGIFSLIQVLHLFEAQPEFSAVLCRASTADITGWPFLCVSIGFTKGAVGALRRGACYTECNRRGTVLEVMYELHQAQFHAFLGLCRKHPATHHAIHLATVRNSMEKDLHSLVKGYRSYLSAEKRRLQAASSVTTRGVGEQRKGKLDFGRSTGFPKRQWAVMGRRRQLRYMTTKESDGP